MLRTATAVNKKGSVRLIAEVHSPLTRGFAFDHLAMLGEGSACGTADDTK